MPELVRQSPLAERRAGGAPASFKTNTAHVAELEFAAAVIRCHRKCCEATAALVARAAGWTLPLTPNTVNAGSHGRALWLEPGAWLIVGAEEAIATAFAALSRESAGQGLLVADLTDGRCVIGVSGPGARALIESGCPVDLHHMVFASGRCAASLFDGTPVLIDQLSDAPSYALITERAWAVSLWDRLSDAARWIE